MSGSSVAPVASKLIAAPGPAPNTCALSGAPDAGGSLFVTAIDADGGVAVLGGDSGCAVLAPLAFVGPCPQLISGFPATFGPSDVALVANTGSGALVSCRVTSGGIGDLGVGGFCNPGTLTPSPLGDNFVLQAVDSLGGIAILGGPGGCHVIPTF